MSDRVYRQVHNHTGTPVNAGIFPKTTITFPALALPVDGDTLIISTVATNPKIILTFTDSPSGANNRRLHNGISNNSVYLGTTVIELYMNIVTAINTYDYETRIGTSDTITAAPDDTEGVVIYENEKITGSVGVVHSGGTAVVTATPGANITGHYSTKIMYNGIQGTANGAVDVLMRNPDTDGYNIGPPHNQLKKETIFLQAGTILPIQTFGCTGTVNVYN
jgi:hypothetical protein